MDIQVPYGKDEKLAVSLNDVNVLDVVYPNKVTEQNETEILLKAVENPIKSGPKFLILLIRSSLDMLFIIWINPTVCLCFFNMADKYAIDSETSP